MSLRVSPRSSVQPVAAPAEPKPDFVIPIKDMAFHVPPGFTVKVGSVIQFVNEDTQAGAVHTVTADNVDADGHPLFSIVVRPQESKTLTVTEAMIGTQTFYCEIHPMMTGQMIVEPADPIPSPPPQLPARLRDTFGP